MSVLTVGICTYRRPYYTIISVKSLRDNLRYNGEIKFLVTGVFTEEEANYYKLVAAGYPISFYHAGNLSDMCNTIARNGGDVWLTILDDYLLRYPIDITPDVDMLYARQDIGCVRLACLNAWGSGSGEPETSADLIMHNNLHWWKISKERTKDAYASGIFCHLYHRRFWNDYGDITPCPPENPGMAELNGRKRFFENQGCTIAIPMRFGQHTPMHPEPFWHFGMWHADDYARYAGSRIRE